MTTGLEGGRTGGGRSLAILAYHKVGRPPAGGWDSWFYVPEKTFAAQLRGLREGGWQVIDLATVLAALEKPDTLPERAVLLTFDDGYRSMRTVALPWLMHFEYPAVVFVASDFIGKVNSFDAGTEPEEAICDWHDLRELARCGVSIQSHGASHRAFSALTPAEWRDELVRSRAVLEAGLGSPVKVVAYPYGDPGEDSQWLAWILRHTGYHASFLYTGGLSRWPVAAPYHLTRLPVGPDTDLGVLLEEGDR